MRVILAMTLLFFISGCGNKGPLYLPAPAAQVAAQVMA